MEAVLDSESLFHREPLAYWSDVQALFPRTALPKLTPLSSAPGPRLRHWFCLRMVSTSLCIRSEATRSAKS